ncbi:MAG: PP0621 family protein [Casimicrobiaceae bacterium]
MGKIIFWIVVFFVVLFALRLASILGSRRRSDDDTASSSHERAAKPRAPLAPGTPTVRCSQCGAFIPKSEAVLRLTGYRCADSSCTDRKR